MLKNKSKEKEVTINELRGIIDSIDTDKNGKINYT